MRVGRIRPRLWGSLLFLLSLSILIAFQNCGDVALSRKVTTLYSTIHEETPQPSFVKPPELFDGVLRLVILLDVSRSMAEAPCPDGIDYKVDGVRDPHSCRAPNGESGVDPSFYRLDAVRDWLNQIEVEVQRRPNLDYKVIIVPFTGGSAQDKWANMTPYSRISPDKGRKLEEWTKWGNIANARDYLNRIQALQTAVMDRFNLPSPPPPSMYITPEIFMTTSIPYPRMQKMQSEITAEIGRLRQSGLAEKSHFEVVFMSDGVPKPHKKNVANIAGFVWRNKTCGRTTQCRDNVCCITIDYEKPPYNCPTACAADINTLGETGQYPNPLQPSCRAACFDALKDFAYDGTYMQMAFDVFEQMGREWGDFTLNVRSKIMSGITQIRGTFLQNSEVRFRFTFAQINPSEIRPAEKGDDINWLERAKTLYPDGRHVTVEGPYVPAPIMISHSGTAAYRLSEFFVYNIQSRADLGNTLNKDSDGDGLFDNEETGAAITNPRSNGYCLDGIRVRFGCATNLCDKNLDLDGDSLNDCDEKSAGTSPYDFDTDGDGIPDGLEIVYRTDPLRSDRDTDQDSDGRSNYEGVLRGLSPALSADRVPDPYEVLFTRTFDSFQRVTLANGQIALVPGYVIDVNNMPISSTVASQDTLELYTSIQKTPASRVLYKMVGGGRKAQKNLLQFVGKVENITNPGDRYWIYLEREVNYQVGSTGVPLNLNEFNILKVRDP